MKRLIIIVIVLLSTTLIAQLQWTENGIPIRQGVNIEWSRAAASLDDGSVVYVWSDTRNGDRDVWAQKIDINGNLLWGEDAVLVNGEIDRQEDPVVINAGDGNVIIAWVDFRNEEAGDIYAQKLNENGNLVWNTIGVPLCLAEDVQISLNIVNDDNGGAYVIWLDSRNPGGVDIYGTHIESSGSIASGWDVNGNPIAHESGSQDGHTFWEDGNGGAIVAWHDTRNASNENLYMQRISADGTLLWDTGGKLLCDATGIQEGVKIAPDGTGSFIFVWRDKRNENNGDIFAHRVDINGDFLWTEEIQVYVANGIQQNPRITTASDGGAIIVWEDGRNDPFTKDIYAQKIALDGNLVWNTSGLALCTEQNDQINPRLINDTNGGCYFIWEDGRIQGHPYEDIYVQHIDAIGNALFEQNGKPICNADGEQFSPLLRRDTDNNLFAVWGDNRLGSTGIYVQILDSAGNIILSANGEIIYYGLCGDACNYEILGDGNKSIIIWEDTRNPVLGRQIFMQVLNNDGSLGLQVNGKAITEPTGSDQEYPDAVVHYTVDGAVIVWQENRADYTQIYAQAVDINGNFLWSNTGIPVGTFLAEQQGAKLSVEYISPDTQNYYVGWSDLRDNWNYGIYAQSIRNGELQWANEGVKIADLDWDDFLTDIVGRFFIWQNECSSNYNIYAKLVDENGNTAPGWSDDGLLVCGASGHQKNAKGVLTPLGLLIVWEDLRNGNMDIYGQIITYSGETLWQNDGIPLIDLSNDQGASDFIYDGYIYNVWQDFRNGNDNDVFIQKYDSTGTELWTPDGVAITNKPDDQSCPCLVKIGDNILILWKDDSSGNSDIYAQKLDLDGQLQWATDGLLVCDAIKKQTDPKAVKDNCGNAIVIWEDTRSSGKTDIYNIFAQKLQVSNLVSWTYDLDQDWNWISFNVEFEDSSLSAVFSELTSNGYIHQVKNQTQSATWYGVWVGNLTHIYKDDGYLVQMNNSASFSATGIPIDCDTNSISLNENWNWIAYFPQVSIPITDALYGIQGNAYQIKNQTQSATWYGVWVGNLTTMEPKVGYKLKMNAPDELFYPTGK